MKTLALAVLAIFATASSASAQDKDPDLPDPSDFGDDGESTEMPVDDSSPVPFEEEGTALSGAEEDPDAPTVSKSSDDDDDSGASGDYDALARRPLTLRAASGQLRWFGGIGGLTEKRAYKKRVSKEGGIRAGGVLSAQYGITDKIQLGLHYGTGTYGDVETRPAENDKGYQTGKAAAVEVHYGLYDWMAIQVELPILLDPFQMAITVGVPMKFQFGDKLAAFVGEDLLTIKFTKMVPFVEDSVSNVRALAADEDGTDQDRGDITIKGGIIYQLSQRAAFRGTFGIIAADFKGDDSGALLWGDLIYSLSKSLDLEARAGFANISEPSDTYTLAVGAAFRI